MKLHVSLVLAALLASGCASVGPGPAGPASPAIRAVAASAPRTPGKTEILWLGQSATRITTPQGKVIVIDPWLTSNPKTPAEFKKLEALGKVDLILATHAHFDHFADGPALANLNHAPIISPQGLQSSLTTLKLVPPELALRMGKSGTFMPFGSGVKITQVHAEHDSELLWKNPATGEMETHVGGVPVGFIIELENGFRIWHTGDTGVFGDMRLIGEIYHPDLMMLPIGGHFVMGPADAAMVVRDMVHPKYVIPIHYGTTPQLAGTPAQLKAALGASPVQVIDIDPGQKVEF